MSNSFVTPWIVAHQTPLSMRFPRQEHWSELHFLLQGIFLIKGSNWHLLLWCKIKCHSVVSDPETPCIVAHQAPLLMRFPRQEHWSRLLRPLPGDLPDPGIEPQVSPTLGRFFAVWATIGKFFTTEPPGKLLKFYSEEFAYLQWRSEHYIL